MKKNNINPFKSIIKQDNQDNVIIMLKNKNTGEKLSVDCNLYSDTQSWHLGIIARNIIDTFDKCVNSQEFTELVSIMQDTAEILEKHFYHPKSIITLLATKQTHSIHINDYETEMEVIIDNKLSENLHFFSDVVDRFAGVLNSLFNEIHYGSRTNHNFVHFIIAVLKMPQSIMKFHRSTKILSDGNTKQNVSSFVSPLRVEYDMDHGKPTICILNEFSIGRFIPIDILPITLQDVFRNELISGINRIFDETTTRRDFDDIIIIMSHIADIGDQLSEENYNVNFKFEYAHENDVYTIRTICGDAILDLNISNDKYDLSDIESIMVDIVDMLNILFIACYNYINKKIIDIATNIERKSINQKMMKIIKDIFAAPALIMNEDEPFTDIMEAETSSTNNNDNTEDNIMKKVISEVISKDVTEAKSEKTNAETNNELTNKLTHIFNDFIGWMNDVSKSDIKYDEMKEIIIHVFDTVNEKEFDPKIIATFNTMSEIVSNIINGDESKHSNECTSNCINCNHCNYDTHKEVIDEILDNYSDTLNEHSTAIKRMSRTIRSLSTVVRDLRDEIHPLNNNK